MSQDFKIAIRFGLYGGILAFIVSLIILLAGKSPMGDAGWMAIWIPIVSIWFALVQIKKANENYISFKSAFGFGTITLIVYSLLYDVIFYIYSVFNPIALDLFKEETIQKFNEAPDVFGGEDSELFIQLIEQTQNLTLEQAIVSDFIYKIIGGLFLVLAISNFVRSKNTHDKENENEQTEEVSIINEDE
ncbi:MAG TPA: hypothetical protein DIU39_04965 [Flavobacteriales bacterium]|nr:hypothetical protein [Flavobacteriales bacterium]|tara:strand:+ start:56128 stop:56694 length:567 start_codon:yes stop_codon:yes gene_type:complete